jgi:hypothetical protein
VFRRDTPVFRRDTLVFYRDTPVFRRDTPVFHRDTLVFRWYTPCSGGDAPCTLDTPLGNRRGPKIDCRPDPGSFAFGVRLRIASDSFSALRRLTLAYGREHE